MSDEQKVSFWLARLKNVDWWALIRVCSPTQPEVKPDVAVGGSEHINLKVTGSVSCLAHQPSHNWLGSPFFASGHYSVLSSMVQLSVMWCVFAPGSVSGSFQDQEKHAAEKADDGLLWETGVPGRDCSIHVWWEPDRSRTDPHRSNTPLFLSNFFHFLSLCVVPLLLLIMLPIFKSWNKPPMLFFTLLLSFSSPSRPSLFALLFRSV